MTREEARRDQDQARQDQRQRVRQGQQQARGRGAARRVQGAPAPQVGDLVPAVVVGTEGIDLVAEPR